METYKAVIDDAGSFVMHVKIPRLSCTLFSLLLSCASTSQVKFTVVHPVRHGSMVTEKSGCTQSSVI